MRIIKKVIKLLCLLIGIFLIYTNYETIKITLVNGAKDVENYMKKRGIYELKETGYLITKKEITSLEDSKISGNDIIIQEEFYPYYKMLTENERKLYKQIYANALNLSRSFKPDIEIKVNDLKKVIEAVYNDHPEIFWFDTSYGYKYTETNNCVQITLNYNETINNIEESKKIFEENTNKIVEEANKLKTNYEKEKYVHDKIIEIVEYDESASLNQSAYSGIVNKRTVCAGYAKSFQYIMTKLGIRTYYVTGIAGGDHAWNIVELDNEFYNVDLTWDDTKQGSHNYFNLNDIEFEKTHKRSKISKNLPMCKGETYKYSYIEKFEDIVKQIIK